MAITVATVLSVSGTVMTVPLTDRCVRITSS